MSNDTKTNVSAALQKSIDRALEKIAVVSIFLHIALPVDQGLTFVDATVRWRRNRM